MFNLSRSPFFCGLRIYAGPGKKSGGRKSPANTWKTAKNAINRRADPPEKIFASAAAVNFRGPPNFVAY